MATESLEYRGWRIELQSRFGDWVAHAYVPTGIGMTEMFVRSEREGGRQAVLAAAQAYIDERMTQGREQP